MTYLALARKYRPKNFDQMTGQSPVLKALSHAILKDRLHHAYLFTGTRGVGKTSLARIFAKCLNCEYEKNITLSPCNQCSSCKEIDEGRYLDVLEIDAASRTKVEDTRDLLENVQYKPQRGRYKIYIIDEVHMLSSHSFNALLKTLEEPPPHVKFLLATTDPQKLPVTVLSRCLQFYLKNISAAHISAYLASVLDQEKIIYQKSALALIAKNADGSMRDALSLLDQAIAYGSGQICENDTAQMLGCISDEKILDLLVMIDARDTEKLLTFIDHLDESGADFFLILDNLLSLLQKIALRQFTASTLETGAEAAFKKFTPENIQLYYQIALLSKRDLPLAPDLKSGFIMTALRLMTFIPEPEESERDENIQKQKKLPELSAHKNSFSSQRRQTEATKNTENQAVKKIKACEKTPAANFSWTDISPLLNLKGIARLLADNCTVYAQDLTQGKIELVLSPQHTALLTSSGKDRLTQAVSDYYKKPCQVTISIANLTAETPFQQKQRETDQKIKSAENALLTDKKIQSFMTVFSAELIPEHKI